MGLRNDTQQWVTPGGGMEEGELPIEAAIRECQEEAGVTPEHLLYLGEGVVETPTGTVRVYCFRGTIDDEEIHGRDDPDHEVRSWEWLDISHGLPSAVAMNLHSKNNVTLRLLGLQDGPVDDGSGPPEEPEQEVHVPLTQDTIFGRAYQKMVP